ncbi:DNA-binding transcriptional regulator, AcrR family [Gillisia sp. Hel1_33_143]|uniref:TetR/AcrR family transcriptional regulator n=1 Tax=unclassified Gillisia TaxID=2615025 RepID=UPI0005511D76|nr:MULTISPECIES: TetR/AcrR family transcriptional regulator [unclassified Gillisia]SDR75133.1 DNA-binding transcriptional regulator, AcrR family [Gillisia sp. Hel1_33_143]
MKDHIIQTAADLFLNLGFKSVTMDDIANKLGISKKTIYSHFSTKTKLVEASTFYIISTISCGIESINKQKMNPIVELFEIKKFAMNNLKDEKSSPQYQLKKYYPEVFASVQKTHLQIMEGSVTTNLERGIKDGLYRANLPIDFISKIYFVGMMGLKDDYHFPVDKYSSFELLESFLEYHLRAIVTDKGLETLNQFIKTEVV